MSATTLMTPSRDAVAESCVTMPQKTHSALNAAGQARYRYAMQSRRRVPKRAVKSRAQCAPRAPDASHSIVVPRVMARKQARR
tara:strand:- start:1138 stop:1386 length:249 start_codon:yes stop_codon:yes gene_type:complete